MVHALFRAENRLNLANQRTDVAEFRIAENVEGCGLLNVAEPRHGRPEVCLRCIPELDDERMAFERLLDDAALNAPSAPVNETDLAETAFPGGVHVLLHDRFDVARVEGVQVEGVFDRDLARHGAV
jgi:hypothetical protein